MNNAPRSPELTVEIRRKHLKAIAEHLGGAAVVARSTGKSVQQISDMIYGRKTFGNRIARDIEAKLHLPSEALDEVAPLPLDAIVASNVARPSKAGFRLVPVLDYVQAGLPRGGSQISYDETTPVPDACPPETYALRVSGHSMEPEFHDGDLIYIDPCRRPISGDFVIGTSSAGIFDESTFKKYVVIGIDPYGNDIFELRPLNPDFPTLNSHTHKMVVTGVCIGHTCMFI